MISSLQEGMSALGRSGGTGRRARFRTWFPLREWRFESSLRHLVTKGLASKRRKPFLVGVPRFGGKLGAAGRLRCAYVAGLRRFAAVTSGGGQPHHGLAR